MRFLGSNQTSTILIVHMDHLSAAGSSATRNLTTTEPSESLNRRKTVDFRFQRPYATSGSFFFNKPMRAMDSRRDFTSKKVFSGYFSELGEKANSALLLEIFAYFQQIPSYSDVISCWGYTPKRYRYVPNQHYVYRRYVSQPRPVHPPPACVIVHHIDIPKIQYRASRELAGSQRFLTYRAIIEPGETTRGRSGTLSSILSLVFRQPAY